MPLHRRAIITMALATAAAGRLARGADGQSGGPAAAVSRVTAFAFAFDGLDGGAIRLADHAGRPILVVNTASQCGYTPQFAALQELWDEFQQAGLMIIAVPSNDFGGQEPGGTAQIAETARQHYGVSFPIAAKTVVRGPGAHPFYRWAAAERPGDLPAWNFHKYLIGRQGHIVDVFASAIDPSDTRVKTAIGRALAAS
jgi:glutathione peroxidase